MLPNCQLHQTLHSLHVPCSDLDLCGSSAGKHLRAERASTLSICPATPAHERRRYICKIAIASTGKHLLFDGYYKIGYHGQHHGNVGLAVLGAGRKGATARTTSGLIGTVQNRPTTSHVATMSPPPMQGSQPQIGHQGSGPSTSATSPRSTETLQTVLLEDRS
jgi:hypothetical protein